MARMTRPPGEPAREAMMMYFTTPFTGGAATSIQVKSTSSVVESLKEEVAAGKAAKAKFAGAALAARLALSTGSKDEEAEKAQSDCAAKAAEAEAKEARSGLCLPSYEF